MPGWAHDGPAFFSWHRVLLLQFENDLQAASQDPGVTIPYWDWTDPASWPFTNDFLGGDGTGRHKQVQTGPFAFTAPARWTLIVKDQPSDAAYLQRQFGADSTAPSLPTSGDVSDAIGTAPYSTPPRKGTAAGPGSSLRFQGQYGVHRRTQSQSCPKQRHGEQGQSCPKHSDGEQGQGQLPTPTGANSTTLSSLGVYSLPKKKRVN